MSTEPNPYRALHVLLDELERRGADPTVFADLAVLATAAVCPEVDAAAALRAEGWEAAPPAPGVWTLGTRPHTVERHTQRLAAAMGPGPLGCALRIRAERAPRLGTVRYQDRGHNVASVREVAEAELAPGGFTVGADPAGEPNGSAYTTFSRATDGGLRIESEGRTALALSAASARRLRETVERWSSALLDPPPINPPPAQLPPMLYSHFALWDHRPRPAATLDDGTSARLPGTDREGGGE